MSWIEGGVAATARPDVAGAVRAALAEAGSLYAWASRQASRETFRGRGDAYGVSLGGVGAVVRHARRGGLFGPLLGDLYFGRPRFERELVMAERLSGAGVPTPAVLAGVRYRAAPAHRADVATEWIPGRDLAATLFGAEPPAGEVRQRLWRTVAALVRRLHEEGFVHPDLQLGNVLIERGTGALGHGGTGAGGEAAAEDGPTAWLLDVDTVERARAAGAARRNLARFFRSWEKWNRIAGPRLTAADREAFLAAYREAR